jgi:tryptophan synthase alpha chain
VGFGISSPQEVTAVSALCDGVVIGSAFERLIEENLGRSDLPQVLAARTLELKEATRAPAS